MIYPILSDNNEVSGTFVRSDVKSWHKSRIEKAHFQFCKRYLEIQNKASNIVSRVELGKYPMIVDINEKIQLLTALFNNMRTLKFKSQPTNAFFATVNQMLGGSSQLPTTAERAVIKSNRLVQFRQHSRKLARAAEDLIDGNEKRICRLSFEIYSPHVIEKLSKLTTR